MRVCVLMGSPKANGNTAELCKPFIDELKQHQAEVEYIALHNKKITPCLGCNHCQNVAGVYGCVQSDDMQGIIKSILQADVLVFATPIYTWQAPAPMKAVMDRMFGITKLFGSAPHGALNEGQAMALLATCGENPDIGTEILDKVLERWCGHLGLPYLGKFAVQGTGDAALMRTEEVAAGTREFARKILEFKRQ